MQADIKHWPFKVIPAEDGRAKIQVKQKSFDPEGVLIKMLVKLKETAEAFLGEPVSDVVITVPVYFNHAQRQSIKQGKTRRERS